MQAFQVKLFQVIEGHRKNCIRTGRDTAGSSAEGGMRNVVCRRCWDRVQIASRASENDDGYRGGIRCIWLDGVGEEYGDSPDAGTGEGAAAGGDIQHHLYRRWRSQQPARSTTRSTSSYTWAALLPKTPTPREISTAAPKSLGDALGSSPQSSSTGQARH